MQTIKSENFFFLNNGTRLRSMEDLRSALRKMNDSTFGYHVNEERNDFYNWIKDVFSEFKLANKIKNVKNKKQMHSIINKFLLDGKRAEKNQNMIKIVNARPISSESAQKDTLLKKIMGAFQ